MKQQVKGDGMENDGCQNRPNSVNRIHVSDTIQVIQII